MQINQEKFYELAEEITSVHNIMSYLSIVAMNISLDPHNIMVLYKQDKNMKTVCGASAWEKFGRTIKPNAPTFIINVPSLTKQENGYKSEYCAAGVIDARYTMGSTFKPRPSPKNLTDTLVALTNRTVELVPTNRLSSSDWAEYNEQHDVFYVSDKLQDSDRYAAIIKAYIKYTMKEKGIEDAELYYAVAYVLLLQYDLNVRSIRGQLFKDLNQRTTQEKYKFLCDVAELSRASMEKLNVAFLTCDETLLVNHIFTNVAPIFWKMSVKDKRESLNKQIEQINKRLTGDEQVLQILKSLNYKLTNCSDGDIERLCAFENHNVHTYPPFELSIKNLEG